MTEVRQITSRNTSIRAFLAGVACCALGAVPLAAAVSDFQLPPSSSQTPAPQGPVVQGVTPPRAVPTPTPSPTPRAVVTPAIRVTPAPTPTPTATRTAAPAPTPRATVAPAPTPDPTAAPSPEPLPSALPEAPPPVSAAPEPLPPPEPAAADADASLSWGWLAVPFLVLLAAGAAIAVVFRRRRAAEPAIAVPQIERPRVPPAPPPVEPEPLPPVLEQQPEPTPTPAAEAEEHEGPLSIAIEARQLSISLTAATLSYRVTLTNTARTSLRDITISGDMISAHSSIPEQDQVASATIVLEERHRIARIPAGETTQLTGEFRLPFTRIRPIRQGGTALLFVPLARLKAEAADGGNGPVLQTALVGQRSEKAGGGLLPFRLDLGPRIYREVTQRIFS